RGYMSRVPGPWFLKPRLSASAIGIRKISRPDELWPVLDELGDKQSYHLLAHASARIVRVAHAARAQRADRLCVRHEPRRAAHGVHPWPRRWPLLLPR